MRRSLSNDAITGMLHPKTKLPIEAVGFRRNGRPIYPIMGASEDDDDGDGSDDGDDAGKDQGKGGDGDDAGGAGGGASDDSRNPRIKELSDEASRHRNRAKQAEADRDAALKKLKDIDDADKSELDKATAELSEAKAAVTSSEDTITQLRIDNAFLTSNKHTWKNPRAALKLADLGEVEIDEDGKVTGLDKALDKLAKSDAYLLASDADDDDDDPTPTGQPPAPKTKGNADRAKLEKKYPGLRR